MIAFRKPTGGVRGIVAGDVIWRLVAQQLGPQVEVHTRRKRVRGPCSTRIARVGRSLHSHFH